MLSFESWVKATDCQKSNTVLVLKGMNHELKYFMWSITTMTCREEGFTLERSTAYTDCLPSFWGSKSDSGSVQISLSTSHVYYLVQVKSKSGCKRSALTGALLLVIIFDASFLPHFISRVTSIGCGILLQPVSIIGCTHTNRHVSFVSPWTKLLCSCIM